ncbi:antA/AntB antirepressor family protein [Bartonella sp. WD12.1]|uniref:antA/AntB antirepressor family protein n=1 Tax=Bartonella sp. WD12.1 TaxID=1933903 RepID=UPI000999C04D|nr:antA/AntB antirepressor family protein [Bartonella sp. WD12.1]OPB29498.1 Phage anti-repressor protein [Bartonella sp. WD12.1]
MNNLIEIKKQVIDQETVQTVNARELCAFLEVGKDFSTWITNRINQYEFVENQDFVCSPILGSKGRGGHNRKEYHLTLDMAKELSMVERNDKGRQARRYFIECEKKLNSQLQFDRELFSRDLLKSPSGIGEILEIIMTRLLDANGFEKELEHYKSVTTEAKRVLESPVAKAA